jgi:hypothetical protein
VTTRVFFWLILLSAHTGFAQERPRMQQTESKDPIVGAWEWTMAMGLMRKKVSMEVVERQGKLVAVVVTPEGNKLESSEFIRKDDRVQFTVRSQEGGKIMIITHDGKLNGDKIVGTAKMTGGPFDMNIKWDATRVVRKPVAP